MVVADGWRTSHFSGDMHVHLTKQLIIDWKTAPLSVIGPWTQGIMTLLIAFFSFISNFIAPGFTYRTKHPFQKVYQQLPLLCGLFFRSAGGFFLSVYWNQISNKPKSFRTPFFAREPKRGSRARLSASQAQTSNRFFFPFDTCSKHSSTTVERQSFQILGWGSN